MQIFVPMKGSGGSQGYVITEKCDFFCNSDSGGNTLELEADVIID